MVYITVTLLIISIWTDATSTPVRACVDPLVRTVTASETSTTICPYNLAPYSGMRISEAKHPGPPLATDLRGTRQRASNVLDIVGFGTRQPQQSGVEHFVEAVLRGPPPNARSH
eukprot:2139850-Pyramimonas_sp.AAC.1